MEVLFVRFGGLICSIVWCNWFVHFGRASFVGLVCSIVFCLQHARVCVVGSCAFVCLLVSTNTSGMLYWHKAHELGRQNDRSRVIQTGCWWAGSTIWLRSASSLDSGRDTCCTAALLFCVLSRVRSARFWILRAHTLFAQAPGLPGAWFAAGMAYVVL